jgi:AraC-like DNA-binding protein
VDFHNFAATDTIELINISFDRDAISDSEVSALFYARTEKGYKLSSDEMRRLIYTAELLEYECEINGDSQKQILEYLLKLIFRKNGCENMIDDKSRYSHAIREALLYIEQHFRENITLADVAKHVGYAPAYFSRLFKDTTGQSYIEALTSLRLSSASALLSNGYSVADACFSSGFGSLSAFFDVFKRKFGVSPSRYK